jgi:hypothetical protein
MRRIALVATPLIAACSTVPPAEPEPPVRGDTPGYTCREEGLGRFVGQQANSEAGAEILRTSGARILRWIPEGAAVTMDLRHDRVNVRLDRQNRIESVTCG